MATNAVSFTIDGEHVGQALQAAREMVEVSDGEVVLDFAAVRRIDAPALAALESLAGAAHDRSVKVVLRDVNVDVYKVLKLVKLAPRFAFAN